MLPVREASGISANNSYNREKRKLENLQRIAENKVRDEKIL